MFFSHANVLAAHQAGINAMASAATIAFDAAERLIKLNLQTTPALVESALLHHQSVLEARDLKQALSVNGVSGQALFEKSLAYAQGYYEIAFDTREQVVHLAETRQAAFSQSLASFFDQIRQASPIASGLASSAANNVLSTAITTFDSANRAARQVVEIAEASLAGAVSAVTPAPASTDAARQASTGIA